MFPLVPTSYWGSHGRRRTYYVRGHCAKEPPSGGASLKCPPNPPWRLASLDGVPARDFLRGNRDLCHTAKKSEGLRQLLCPCAKA